MALGYKINETRSWATSYRGRFAIHAAKTRKALEDADDILKDAGIIGPEDTTIGGMEWPLGEIVSVTTLVDCIPTEKVRDGLTRCERAMGNYEDGRFAWITKDLTRIRPGIPFRGMQGLKPLPKDVEDQILLRVLETAKHAVNP